MNKIIIAIDGFSSCGKSTMAKDLAKEIGYIYIDSGAMYRAVTLYCIEHGLFLADGSIDEDKLKQQMSNIHISFRLDTESGRPRTFLNGTDVENQIRTLEVSSHVSPVAALGFVREALVRQQQELGKEKGIVMDGRDIGTTILPNAEVKIYLTASADTRARRRALEYEQKGEPFDLDQIRKDIIERDERDMNREVSPLRQADDAVLVDSSEMGIDDVVNAILDVYKEKVQK